MSEHQRKVQRNTHARDFAIISLLLGTGIRVSECVGLNLSDVDFETNAFTVTRKGGNQAILYFGDEVADALKTYIDTERKALIDRCQKMNVGDTDAVFLSLQVTRLSVRAIQNIVKKYAQTAAPLKKSLRISYAARSARTYTEQPATYTSLPTFSVTAT